MAGQLRRHRLGYHADAELQYGAVRHQRRDVFGNRKFGFAQLAGRELQRRVLCLNRYVDAYVRRPLAAPAQRRVAIDFGDHHARVARRLYDIVAGDAEAEPAVGGRRKLHHDAIGAQRPVAIRTRNLRIVPRQDIEPPCRRQLRGLPDRAIALEGEAVGFARPCVGIDRAQEHRAAFRQVARAGQPPRQRQRLGRRLPDDDAVARPQYRGKVRIVGGCGLHRSSSRRAVSTTSAGRAPSRRCRTGRAAG